MTSTFVSPRISAPILPDEFARFEDSSLTAPNPPTATASTLSVWTPQQILDWEPSPDADVLEGGFLRRGELAVLAGQPGLGKSRLALYLAIRQIIGGAWLDMKTIAPARRWLFIGNENSIARLKYDLTRMLGSLTEAEQEMVCAHLFVHVPLTPDDCMLDLEDLAVRCRIEATIKQHYPGNVVFDPWGAMTADEDKTAETRFAVKELLTLCRKCGDPMVLILAHARTGASNIAQGVGWNKGAYMKGSKVLYAAARCVFNLMPGDPEDETKLVLSCGKANNSKPFPPRGVKFNPDTFDYLVDENFDMDSWRDDLDGKRKGQSVSIKDVTDEVRSGHRTRGEIVEALHAKTGVSAPTIDRRIKDALSKGWLIKVPPVGNYAVGKVCK